MYKWSNRYPDNVGAPACNSAEIFRAEERVDRIAHVHYGRIVAVYAAEDHLEAVLVHEGVARNMESSREDTMSHGWCRFLLSR